MLIVAGALGGQLDHIAVGIAEIDRIDEAVIGNAARLFALGLPFLEHSPQILRFDFKRDMKVIVVLVLEFEGHVRRFEKCQE